ncbi:MAG: potassium channel family protein, partial [Candidatus Zixiibacteriota bacterium]
MAYGSSPYRAVFLALAALVLLGPVGFVILEDMSYFDSLYMTVITVSTVGFGEVRPLGEIGRWYVIFLILFGLFTASIVAKELGRSIVEGQLRRFLGKRKMDSQLKRLSNHTIIAGYGRVGQEVVHEFEHAAADKPFVVIESDSELVDALNQANILHVVGDATLDETLERAGIAEAATLVSTLPGDSENVYLTLTAQHLKPGIVIIARADQPECRRKLLRAGATHVVSPHLIGGSRMANLAIRPHLERFIHTLVSGDDGLGVEELVVADDSALIGKTLGEVNCAEEENV